jgi:hypothetical protein
MPEATNLVAISMFFGAFSINCEFKILVEITPLLYIGKEEIHNDSTVGRVCAWCSAILMVCSSTSGTMQQLTHE